MPFALMRFVVWLSFCGQRILCCNHIQQKTILNVVLNHGRNGKNRCIIFSTTSLRVVFGLSVGNGGGGALKSIYSNNEMIFVRLCISVIGRTYLKQNRTIEPNAN